MEDLLSHPGWELVLAHQLALLELQDRKLKTGKREADLKEAQIRWKALADVLRLPSVIINRGERWELSPQKTTSE